MRRSRGLLLLFKISADFLSFEIVRKYYYFDEALEIDATLRDTSIFNVFFDKKNVFCDKKDASEFRKTYGFNS